MRSIIYAALISFGLCFPALGQPSQTPPAPSVETTVACPNGSVEELMVILGDTYHDTITDLNLVAFTDRWQALGGPEITFSYDKVIAIPGRSAVAIMFFDGDCFSAGINVPAEVYLALMGVRI